MRNPAHSVGPQQSLRFAQLDRWLRSIHTLPFICLMTASTFMISVLMGALATLLERGLHIDITSPPSPLDFGIAYIIYAATLVPIIETAVFQQGSIRLLNGISVLKGRTQMLVVISAAIFGLAHFQDLASILHAFLIGLVLSYAYVLRRENAKQAFWTIVGIHSARNLISGLLGFLWMNAL